MFYNESRAVCRAIETIRKALAGESYESAVKICGGKVYDDIRDICAKLVEIADAFAQGAGTGGGGGGGGVDQTARNMAQAAQNTANAAATQSALDATVTNFTSAYQNEITLRATGDQNLDNAKQDKLSSEQLATVNADPFIAAYYSSTAEMTTAIQAAIEAAEVKGVIKFAGYISVSAPVSPAINNFWLEGTRPATPDFTGLTVKRYDGATWSVSTYTPEMFHLWSDLNDNGSGHYIFPFDKWNNLDFTIDLSELFWQIQSWVLEQLDAYQSKLTPEQLAAVNSGITANNLSALQTAVTTLNDFKNRSAGFAPLTHQHGIDDIGAFTPGQFATVWPDYNLNITPRDWIKRMVNAGRANFPSQRHFTPMITTAYWLQFDAMTFRMEFEIFPTDVFEDTTPMPYYMKFRYNGNGIIQDLMPGGSIWHGTPQAFKTNLWIPLPAGAQPLVTVNIGMDVEITFVTTNPVRPECVIKPFP